MAGISTPRMPGRIRLRSFARAGLHAGKPKEAEGFVPTEWLPTGLVVESGHLYVATGKGKGTGPNKRPRPPIAGLARSHRSSTYIATLLYGSVSAVDLSQTRCAAA